MAKLPSERPESLLEFVLALEDALGTGAPVGPMRVPPAVEPARPLPADVHDAGTATVPAHRFAQAAAPTVAAAPPAEPTVAAIPATEPREEPGTVVDELGEGERTELHERSGAPTYADRRRPWPGPAGAAPADAPEVVETAEVAAPAAPVESAEAAEPTAPVETADTAVVSDTAAASAVTEPPAPAAPARARRPRRLAPALAAAALLLAAIAGGTLAGGTGEQPAAEPGPAPERVAFTAGPLTLDGPAGWDEISPPEIAGLSLDDAAAVGDRDAAMVAGLTPAGGAGLLPRGITDPGEPEPVALGNAQAYRYAPAGGELTLLVAPTTAGVATIACTGPAAARSRCERAAASLALGDGARAYRLGPSERYARELGRALDALADERTSAVRALKAADLPRPQATAAADAATAYGRGATALGKVAPNPPERAAHAALRAAVRDGRTGYAKLADAARGEHRAAYGRARARIARADARIDRALTQLAALGYRVR